MRRGYGRRKWSGRRKRKRSYGGRRFRRGSFRKARYIKRIASAAAWKNYKRVAELKWQAWPLTELPGSPITVMGTQRDAVNVRFGNMTYTGVAQRPLVIDPFHTIVSSGTNMHQMIGNKILARSVHLKANIMVNEDQAAADEVIARVMVVRAKQSFDFNTSVLTDNAVVANMLLGLGGVSAAPVTADQWFSLPIDRKKFSVYKDKRYYRHATPASITGQLNCHFSRIPIDVRLKWRRGKIIQFNQSRVVGDNNIEILNPIMIVIQVGALTTGAPVIPPSITGALSFDGHFYISFNDS